MADEYQKKLEAILQKASTPVDSVALTINVNGIYSLPELWVKQIGVDDTPYAYNLEICGASFKDISINPREMTDEEKRLAEESKSKKGAAPKEKKKDAKKKEDETEKAEKELEEKKAKEKEEAEKKAKAEWDILDEETKFIRTKEDKYKDASISIATKEQAITKEGEALVALEEYVNNEGGFWIQFTKAPPPEPEDPKKKAAKPKKGAVEPEKPIEGRAWVDMTKIKMPGGLEVSQRCFFQTLGIESQPGLFEQARTYVYINIKLSKPINPAIREPINLNSLIPKKPPVPKHIVPKDCIDEFNMQVQIAIEALSKEYIKYSGAFEPKSQIQLSNQQEEEKRAVVKNKFLHDLNTSGKFQILMEKLKRSVVKIVREKFNIKSQLKGISFTENDKIFSNLYSFMVDQIKGTVNSIVMKKKDLLHHDVVSSCQTEIDKILGISTRAVSESQSQRLIRLGKEYIFRKEYAAAEKYYLEGIKLNDRDVAMWIKYYNYSMASHNYNRALFALTECLGIDPDNTNYNLLYSGLLFSQGKYKEADIYLRKMIELNSFDIASNIMLAIVSEFTDKKVLATKYLAVALRRKMRDLNIIPLIGKLKDGVKLPTRALTPEEIDSIYLSLASFFTKYKVYDVSEKILAKLTNKDSEDFLMQMSVIKYKQENYKDALITIGNLLSKNSRNVKAIALKGHCLMELKEFTSAEEAYIRTIRLNPKGKLNAVFLKLGTIYINKQSWLDANVVFYSACQQANTSYAWQYLGLSDIKLNKYDEAEKCLSRANILDNKNADIWAYLAYVDIKKGKLNQAFQCLREAIKLEILNADIVIDIISELANNNLKDKANEFIEALPQKLKCVPAITNLQHAQGASDFMPMATLSKASSSIIASSSPLSLQTILEVDSSYIRRVKYLLNISEDTVLQPDTVKQVDGIIIENIKQTIAQAVKTAAEIKKINKNCITILKLGGIRIGKLKGSSVPLEKGKQMKLAYGTQEGDATKVYCNLQTISQLEKGEILMIMGGGIQCKVIAKEAELITLEILNSGVLLEESRILINSSHIMQNAQLEKEVGDSIDFICINCLNKESLEFAKQNYKCGVIGYITHNIEVEQIDNVVAKVDGFLLEPSLICNSGMDQPYTLQDTIVKKAHLFQKFVIIENCFVNL